MSSSFNPAKAYSYSRKVLPLGWRNIRILNKDTLRFLGEANLNCMLLEWRILNAASKTRLKFLEQNDGAYYAMENIDNVKQTLKHSKFAIREISSILPSAEPKPIFATHRPFENIFSPGEKVFTVLEDDAIFYPATVIEQVFEKVFIRFDNLNGEKNGMSDYNTPLLLKSSEVVYLAKNWDYANLYACASGFPFEEDRELFLDMIEDCIIMYFPEVAKTISRPTEAL